MTRALAYGLQHAIGLALLTASGTAAIAQTGNALPSTTPVAPANVAPAPGSATPDTGLAEIVVTAQRRSQSVQDVPIAVTALSGETLQANRVTNVTDLTGLAPGVTVRTSAGGSQLPVFAIRGVLSYGVVPGSDKQVSQYIDGVYVASPRGSIFDLPDLERIEILRGPQGTLFGRNATAGAVNITTRDPTGQFGFRGEASYGNRDAVRLRGSLDLPSFGPFSAYVSYLHDERHGDIENLGAGQVWTRPVGEDSLVPQTARSPRYLGSKNTNTIFGALKFASGDFTTVYKVDWTKGDNTPEGTALVAVNPAVGDAGPAVAGFLQTLIASQSPGVPIAANGKRPDAVTNSYVIPSSELVMGHNLTSTWDAGDGITVKNILAYRKSHVFAAQSLDGFSGLPITAAAGPLFGLPPSLIGQPFLGVVGDTVAHSSQWSDELQANYKSRLLTLTVGGMWFHSTDTSNTFPYSANQAFAVAVNGAIPAGGQGAALNKLTSLAAYAQAEIHVTPQLDVVLGGRITRDRKFGQYDLSPPAGTPQVITTLDSRYRNTRPTYLAGVNYKLTENLLLYAKYSTAFVSGGSIAGVPFKAEKARSAEGGIKSEFFDRRLRANLAVYWARYDDSQISVAGVLVAGLDPRIGTAILNGGNTHSKGVELEINAAPTRGVQLGGSVSYSDSSISNVNPLLLASNGGGYVLTYRPKWTGNLFGEYHTRPLFDDTYLAVRADANYQSRSNVDFNPARSESWAPNAATIAPYWVVNGRLSLRDLKIGGVNTELALWGKNLFDNRSADFGLILFNQIAAENFIPARSYGMDLIVKF